MASLEAVLLPFEAGANIRQRSCIRRANSSPFPLQIVNQKGLFMPLASLCFRTAVIIALIGFGLGIGMGMARDFTLAPAHAHLNLLGYVSFFLYGAFYALLPSAANGVLPRIHYFLALIGAVLMTGGIAAVVYDYRELIPLAFAGAFIAYAGLLVFAWIVFRAKFQPSEER
jgi:hypothetical protein